MRTRIICCLLLILSSSAASAAPIAAQTLEAAVDEEGKVHGEVALQEVPCRPAAETLLRSALALLHNMTYEQARLHFQQVIAIDPDCVLGYWGVAMTYIHPLWGDQPTDEQLQAGGRLLAAAESRGVPTPYETAFLLPVYDYYEDAAGRTEKERLRSFASGWAEAVERFPEDLEIRLFHALSILASAQGKPDRVETHARAGGIAMDVAEVAPRHPGALHYAIHAFDLPELAARGEMAARLYGEVVPENAHALHMTSHIFTRLGTWDESIRYNRRAAEASIRPPLDPRSLPNFFHASDYLVYALLQRGEDDSARAVYHRLIDLVDQVPPDPAAAFALAAIPTRLVLERQQWGEAARLETRPPGTILWDQMPHLEAVLTFGRGLGGARSGDLTAARSDLTRLAQLREQSAALADPFDWAAQVRIQELALTAWILLAEGEEEEALRRMEEAHRLSTNHEKHPVSPGDVLPAAELHGDMLLHLRRPAKAHEIYAVALERAPNRLNSLYGAGRAAEALGHEERARQYYLRLTQQASEAAELERIRYAAAFLGRR